MKIKEEHCWNCKFYNKNKLSCSNLSLLKAFEHCSNSIFIDYNFCCKFFEARDKKTKKVK